MNKKNQIGVTLIELMIVVIIIGIIASIAYPSYTRFVINGNRSAAQQLLLEIASKQQQYMMDNRQYVGEEPGAVSTMTTATALTTLGVTVPQDVSQYYTVKISVNNTTASPPTFEIKATPLANSMQSSDATLSINHLGNKVPIALW